MTDPISPSAQPLELGAPVPNPSAPPRTIGQRLLYWLLVFSLVLITWASTPLTERVDEVKFLFLFILGPGLLALYCFLATIGSVPKAPRSVTVLLMAYVAAMLLSTLFSGYRLAGLYTTGYTLAGIGFFYAAIGSIRSREDLENLLLTSGVICLGTVLFALAQHGGLFQDFIHWFYGGTMPQPVFSGSPEQVSVPFFQTLFASLAQHKEASSTLFNRDFYGAYLDMILPPILGLAVISSRARRQGFAFSVYALGILATYLTMSKNDYAIAAFTPFLFAFLCWRVAGSRPMRSTRWRLWVLGFAVLGATYTFLHGQQIGQKLKLFTPEALGRNVESRLILWHGAWDIFKDHPIWGGGPGSYLLLFPQHRNVDYLLNEVGDITPNAHSLYLDTLSETGLIGFATRMGFIALVLFLTLRHMRRAEDGRLRLLLAGLFCGMIGVLLASATSPHLSRPAGHMWLYATFGAAVAGVNLSLAKARRPEQSLTQASPGTRGFSQPAIGGWVITGIAFVLFVAGSAYGWLQWKSTTDFSVGKIFFDVRGSNERLERAAWYFEKSIRENPASVDGYYKVASAYRALAEAEPDKKQEWLKKSIASYERLQKLSPDYASIHTQFGTVFVDLASQSKKSLDDQRLWLEKAAAEFDHSAALSSDLSTQKTAAGAHEQLASVLLSLAMSKGAGKKGPALGQASFREIGKAADIYQRILTYDPQRPDVKAGDPGLLQTRRAYGFLLYHLNRDMESLEQLYRYLLQVPGDKEASDALARAMNRATDRKRMDEMLAELVRSNPLRIDYRIYRFTMLKAEKRYDEAWLEVQRALRLVPGEQRSLMAAGELQLRFGHLKEAREYLNQAIQAQNSNPKYRQDAEDMLKRLDDYEQKMASQPADSQPAAVQEKP